MSLQRVLILSIYNAVSKISCLNKHYSVGEFLSEEGSNKGIGSCNLSDINKDKRKICIMKMMTDIIYCLRELFSPEFILLLNVL